MTDASQTWDEEEPRYLLSLDPEGPDDPGAHGKVISPDSWADEYQSSGWERREQMAALASRGKAVRLRDNAPLPERDLILLRRRLSLAMQGLDYANAWQDWKGAETGPIRYLVEGLMPWGTCPTLGGQYGVGKTRLLVNLLRSLVDPSFRFLGRFGPSTLTHDELGRMIVVLNAETSPIQFEGEMRRAGLVRDDENGLWGVLGLHGEDSRCIRVIHLEMQGGPGIFDLTDGDKLDDWVFRLNFGWEGDEWGPVMLIVDTMTAVLLDAGKDHDHYPRFIASFRRLLRICDIPNGLIVGHSFGTTRRLLGSPEAMANQDGRMSYMSADAENPLAERKFGFSPRGLGPTVPEKPVVIGSDEMLYLRGYEPKAASASRALTAGKEAPVSQPPGTVRDAVWEYLGRCNAENRGPSKRDVRRDVPGPNSAKDEALAEFLAESLIEDRGRHRRGGGASYWQVSQQVDDG